MQTESHIILKDSLDEILKSFLAEGKTVIGPVQKEKDIVFELINDQSILASDFIQTKLSLKSFVFPGNEKLFSFKKSKGSVEVEDVDLQNLPEVVLWGIKPCDAFGFSALKAIFNEDYQDKIFNSRNEKLLLITFSCSHSDENCFCTSVGGGPGAIAGSDILFTKTDDQIYIAEIISEKGKKIFTRYQEYFLPMKSELKKENFLTHVDKSVPIEEIKNKIDKYFESDLWSQQSERCLGCGACAYVCPACGCFDIQDETFGNEGIRLRCWDSCGFSQFTVHASGHNPRKTQAQRWRQRIMHKFSIMPERLNMIGCTGCGRCSRACPADMNLLEHLVSIMNMKDEQ